MPTEPSASFSSRNIPILLPETTDIAPALSAILAVSNQVSEEPLSAYAARLGLLLRDIVRGTPWPHYNAQPVYV